MKADITRNTWKKEKHYRKVNMQQGRVDLDADWNEQLDIQLNHDLNALRDIIGRTGAPKENAGFEIKPSKNGYTISKGRFYVDGILCENDDEDVEAGEQKDLPSSEENNSLPSEDGKYIIYLDVWPRHITALEDLSIREVALGGADTATRTKYVWQVKWSPLPENFQGRGDNACNSAFVFLKDKLPKSDGRLKAKTREAQPTSHPCEMPPDTRYRGIENHLYRVEIHDDLGETGNGGTFKWSRDNGIVVAKVTDIISSGGKHEIRVSSIGRDRSNLGFNTNQWIEIIDDRRELWGLPGTMVKLVSVEDNKLLFDPNSVRAGDLPITYFANQDYNPKVRRWDSEYKDEASGITSGMIPITIGGASGSPGDDGYIELEDGIQIKFEFTEGQKAYKSGDYWNLAARTAIGDIEWPNDDNGPVARSIDGIDHHYAPLAIIEYDTTVNNNGEVPEVESPIKIISDCRRIFSPAIDPILYYVGGDGQHGSANSELMYPLVAGIARGNVPVEGVEVTFSVVEGGGELRDEAGNPGDAEGNLSVKSDNDGLVECFWKLGTNGDQQVVQAVMIDHDNNKKVHLPLRYNAIMEQPRAVVTPLVHTGIIEIPLSQSMPLVGPFKHFLDTNVPPAILLGRIKRRHAVSIGGAYSPNRLEVGVGDTVTWTNNDEEVQHTVTSGSDVQPDGRFDSGIMAPQQTFAHTFTEAGEYPYFCELHPNMVGNIIVRSQQVRFMEDYYLYRSEIVGDDTEEDSISPGFKPVNITTTNFHVRLINLPRERGSLTLRWWAINGEEQDFQGIPQ